MAGVLEAFIFGLFRALATLLHYILRIRRKLCKSQTIWKCYVAAKFAGAVLGSGLGWWVCDHEQPGSCGSRNTVFGSFMNCITILLTLRQLLQIFLPKNWRRFGPLQEPSVRYIKYQFWIELLLMRVSIPSADLSLAISSVEFKYKGTAAGALGVLVSAGDFLELSYRILGNLREGQAEGGGGDGGGDGTLG